jgi:hypothetical protein
MFYRAKDGIYSTYLPRTTSSTLYDFVGAAIAWSDDRNPARFRILDTFLSDSMSDALLSGLARQLSQRGGTMEILLTCPDSQFAIARGLSIGQRPSDELETGLKRLHGALRANGLVKDKEAESKAKRDSLVSTAQLLTSDDTDKRLSLRFYTVAPSAPMYFLGDLLVSSRFSHGNSSVENPWMLIVDDERMNEDDVYSSYAREFKSIWDTASPSPIGVPPLSFDSEEERPVAVLFLEIVPFSDKGALGWQLDAVHTICEALTTQPRVQDAWPDDLICIHVGDGAALAFLNSRDALAAVEVARDLRKRAKPHEFPQLRQGVAYGRVAVGRTSAATRTCIGQPMQIAARVMTSCEPGEIRVTEPYYELCMNGRHPWADLASASYEVPVNSGLGIHCRTIRTP